MRSYQTLKGNKKAVLNKDISEVLLINTGGALSMVKSGSGYKTEKGLIERLKYYSCFNDSQINKDLNLSAS